MKRNQSSPRVKRHIISMRISAEEWNSLHETMKSMDMRRVSDLMREAFKLVLSPTQSLETAATEGPQRTG